MYLENFFKEIFVAESYQAIYLRFCWLLLKVKENYAGPPTIYVRSRLPVTMTPHQLIMTVCFNTKRFQKVGLGKGCSCCVVLIYPEDFELQFA